MNENNYWIELKNTVKLFSFWALTTIIDTLFLAIWVLIQWIVGDKVITPIELTGIDNYVLIIFKIMFAVSTLAPVVITVYRDIRIMLIRTQNKIRQEINNDKDYE